MSIRSALKQYPFHAFLIWWHSPFQKNKINKRRKKKLAKGENTVMRDNEGMHIIFGSVSPEGNICICQAKEEEGHGLPLPMVWNLTNEQMDWAGQCCLNEEKEESWKRRYWAAPWPVAGPRRCGLEASGKPASEEAIPADAVDEDDGWPITIRRVVLTALPPRKSALPVTSLARMRERVSAARKLSSTPPFSDAGGIMAPRPGAESRRSRRRAVTLLVASWSPRAWWSLAPKMWFLWSLPRSVLTRCLTVRRPPVRRSARPRSRLLLRSSSTPLPPAFFLSLLFLLRLSTSSYQICSEFHKRKASMKLNKISQKSFSGSKIG